MTKLLDEMTFDEFLADADRNAAQDSKASPRTGAAMGTLVGFTESGDALIRMDVHGENLVARSIAVLADGDVGHDVALVFEEADSLRPIVLGVLRTSARPPERNPGVASLSCNLEIDRKSIELRAERQIVLRCGSASVTLKCDGRIIVRGTDILSRSTGLNRIKGGAVEIN
jgi:Domain of unknown function (DUF6484)